jgi:hypothetical protein
VNHAALRAKLAGVVNARPWMAGQGLPEKDEVAPWTALPRQSQILRCAQDDSRKLCVCIEMKVL